MNSKWLAACAISLLSSFNISILTLSTAYGNEHKIIFTKGAPVWKDSKTGNSFKIRGRVYEDFLTSKIKLDKKDTSLSGFEMRTGRLGVEGKYSVFKYKAEFDFAGGDVTAKDVYVQYVNKGLAISFGNQKTPNSLDEQTSSRYITFMERGLVTDSFNLDRRIGLAASYSGSNYTLKAGIYGGNAGDEPEHAFEHEDIALAGRITYAPINQKHKKIHLGIHARYLEPEDNTIARWRSRASAHNMGRVIDTKGSAPYNLDNSTLYGFEFAGIYKSFHATAEYMIEKAETAKGSVEPKGYFAQIGYFLTGETRSYKANKGSFGRTKPHTPLSKGGYGAFEIATRYDYLDLSDANKLDLQNTLFNEGYGGKLETYTLGFNWYPENHLKLALNYIHGKVKGKNAKYGNGDLDAVQFRVQFDW